MGMTIAQKKRMHSQRRESSESYRLKDEYIDNLPFSGMHDHHAYRPDEKDLVGGGAWVLVTRQIPVSEDIKPRKFGIYWAVPCTDSKNGDGYDQSGRYKVEVAVPNRSNPSKFEIVGMFPHEYSVVSDERLEIYKDEGWGIIPIDLPADHGVDMALVEQGRSLSEEEREIIWALQVDGLDEHQACQEYFYSRHQDGSQAFYYFPSPEVHEYISEIFYRDFA